LIEVIDAEPPTLGAVEVFVTGALVVELAGLEVATAAAGLVVEDKLCLPAKGVRLASPDTDARGREAVAVAVAIAVAGLVPLTGDVTEPRAFVAVDAVVGLELAEAESEGFRDVGAEVLAGTMEALRLGTAAAVAEVAVLEVDEAMGALAVGAGPLTDFLRGAADALGAAEDAEGVGLDVAGLPAPNVPELSI
jgi:hypothetical protein